MKNKNKWININYISSIDAKEWMNENLGAQDKSKFIREAVSVKIEQHKIDKKAKKLSKSLSPVCKL